MDFLFSRLICFVVFRGLLQFLYFSIFGSTNKHFYLGGPIIKSWNFDCLEILLLDLSTWSHYRQDVAFNSTEVESPRCFGLFFLLLIDILLRQSLSCRVLKESQIRIEKRCFFRKNIHPPLGKRPLRLHCLGVAFICSKICLWLDHLFLAIHLWLFS